MKSPNDVRYKAPTDHPLLPNEVSSPGIRIRYKYLSCCPELPQRNLQTTKAVVRTCSPQTECKANCRKQDLCN